MYHVTSFKCIENRITRDSRRDCIANDATRRRETSRAARFLNGFVSRRGCYAVHIVVIGAGAMGSFFGGLLSRRNDVLLVGRRGHMEAIRRSGLRITGKTNAVCRPRVAVDPRGVRSADVVLISTKAYDTATAMRSARKFATSSIFVTLQNGLDNANVIAKSAKRVVVGVTSHGVTYVRPGEVRHAGVGDTVLGPFRGAETRDARRLRDLFGEAGIGAELSRDIRRDVWLKAIVNAAINPLAALAEVPNGGLLRVPELARAVELVAIEGAKVSRFAGFDITDEEATERVLRVVRRTKDNRCSMLQDLERGRRTEVLAINGALVREAARYGFDASLNRLLTGLVQARESARSAP